MHPKLLIKTEDLDFPISEEEDIKLGHLPESLYYLTEFVGLNVIGQAVVDLVLETSSLTGLFVKLPIRIEFMFLTLISAMLGYFTMKGIREREIDITRSYVLVSIVVEIALLTGDITYILFSNELGALFIALRAPFMLFTFTNICVMIWIYKKAGIFNSKTYDKYYHTHISESK